ncbi:hypothetical protein [Bacillus sp. B1-b2]|uniref:hypothetical protein n=1 Tax=Bacillus sp. B1-b2 TaxID=2653201 RepID=UPI001D00226E|nr:hypothetical protein [Bacillus sp. B1-b2]
MFHYQSIENVEEFKQIVLPYLEKEEAINGLALGILMKLKNNDVPILMGYVTKHQKPYIALLQTHPRQIIATFFSAIQQAELKDISKILHHSIEQIPGFIGEKEPVLELATNIAAIRGLHTEVGMDQRIYELHHVKKKPANNGEFIFLTMEHLPIATQWIYEFSKDTNDPLDIVQAEKKQRN